MTTSTSYKNKRKFKDNVVVLSFNSHNRPVMKEAYGKDWIYFGEKNDYPKYLTDLFYNSSKHNAIVNGKCKYIAGNGWNTTKEVLANPEENLNKFTKKIVLDKEIYGGFAIEVIWKLNGKAEFRHIPFGHVRSNKDNTEFYYTKEWLTKRGTPVQQPENNEDWKVYKPFDGEKSKDPQIIYYKDYCPNIDVYPLPEYEAAILYIDLEYQVANYWYNRVKNGFMPSAILNFYMGQPSDEEMKALEDKIKAKFAGTNNAGQFILNFASGKDFAADIQQLSPPELGAEYENLNKTLQTEVFTGHGVTNGMLFGIKEAGQLGGRTEIIEANELFQARYVTPAQRDLEEFFGEFIFPYIGVNGLMLNKQEPIGYMFSESVIRDVLPQKAIAEMVADKMGIDLSKYPEEPKEEKEEPQKFSKEQIKEKEDKLLAFIKSKAVKPKVKKTLYSRPVTEQMFKNLSESENEIKMIYESFAEKKIPIIIGAPAKPVPTDLTPGTEVVRVVYQYGWIDGYSDADLDDSRLFCKDLREMSISGMRWRREDIDTISTAGYEDSWGGIGDDVWQHRGGWRTIPNTDIHVPQCRHIWVQEVILETI